MTAFECTFSPGDYVITKDGEKGYVIEKVPSNPDYYAIRLIHSYAFKHKKDLELDYSK